MRPSVFSATSVQEVEAHLEDASKEGLKPTLAVVFSSIAHDLKGLGAIFASTTSTFLEQALMERYVTTKSMRSRSWRCCLTSVATPTN